MAGEKYDYRKIKTVLQEQLRLHQPLFRTEQDFLTARIVMASFAFNIGQDEARSAFLAQQIEARKLTLYRFPIRAFVINSDDYFDINFFSLANADGKEALNLPGLFLNPFHSFDGPSFDYSFEPKKLFDFIQGDHPILNQHCRVILNMGTNARSMLRIARACHKELTSNPFLIEESIGVTRHLIEASEKTATHLYHVGKQHLIRQWAG